jgi:hypothetical protein
MFDDNSDTPARGRSLKHRLKSKSRRRREGAARLAAPSAAPRVLRNDILPTLELVCLPLQDLRSAKRQVRKIDPVHVREVAATMAALGFCVPVLGKNRHPSGRLARPDLAARGPCRRTADPARHRDQVWGANPGSRLCLLPRGDRSGGRDFLPPI